MCSISYPEKCICNMDAYPYISFPLPVGLCEYSACSFKSNLSTPIIQVPDNVQPSLSATTLPATISSRVKLCHLRGRWMGHDCMLALQQNICNGVASPDWSYYPPDAARKGGTNIKADGRPAVARD